MFGLPLIVTASITVAATGLLFWGVMWLAKGRLRFRAVEGHNDITGFVFATVGVLYSVLLAFVVIAVWDKFSATQESVSAEAATMVTAYRDTQTFPEPQRSVAEAAYRTYAMKIMATEWAVHGELRPHATPDLLNPIYDVYREVPAKTPAEADDMGRAMDHLHELEMARHERHLSLESTLAPIFWLMLVIGAILTMVFLFVFQFESRQVHAALTGLLAAALAASLFLIMALDRPFTGGVKVSKYPFEHALLQLDAIDKG